MDVAVATTVKDVALLEVGGALSVDEGALLDERLATIEAAGKLRIVLDLSDVKYMSSSVFGVLVKHAQQLGERGGGLALLGVPPKVNVVIDMLGIEPVFACVCKHRPGAFARPARAA
jgi:anti-anti-sigma factor